MGACNSSENVDNPAKFEQPPPGLLLGRYRPSTGSKAVLGQGCSSTCYRCEDIDTGKFAAVKVYKKSSREAESVRVHKFKRQVHVLGQLTKPLQPPSNKALWDLSLEAVAPQDIFVQMLEHSRCSSTGEPGPSPEDGGLYIATEMAQQSLKAFLGCRPESGLPWSQVRALARDVVLAAAGLHAKGFVHLDLKPENLMFFGSRLKLIDVDGCAPSGSALSPDDPHLSFSPVYASPEWARFMIDPTRKPIKVAPSMDVWSVGITLCDLVAEKPIFNQQFLKFKKPGRPRDCTAFFRWLGDLADVPFPQRIVDLDGGFHDLIAVDLAVPDARKRKTLAQCLSGPFLSAARHARS